MALAIHEIEGRVRIKSDAINKDDFKQEVFFNLLKQKGIENININSKNSCCTIHYNPEVLNCSQIKQMLGLNLDSEQKQGENILQKSQKNQRAQKGNGAYTSKGSQTKLEAENLLKVENKTLEKGKDVVLDLAKVFGSTWFKTALKETVSMAFKGSNNLTLTASSQLGRKFLRTK